MVPMCMCYREMYQSHRALGVDYLVPFLHGIKMGLTRGQILDILGKGEDMEEFDEVQSILKKDKPGTSDEALDLMLGDMRGQFRSLVDEEQQPNTPYIE